MQNLNENEEKALDEHPIKYDGRGIYTSKSADVHANNSSRGKLNEEQLNERASLHAKRQATGIPTVKDIAEHWYSKYNITMTVQAENEWVRNNQDRIDNAAAKLYEDGDMPVVVVSPSTIASQLGAAGRDIVQLIKINKRTQTALSNHMEDFVDPYKMIGATNKEAYWKSEGDTRKEFDNRLDHAIKVNKSNLDNYRTVSNSTVEQGKLLVEMMKLVSEINKSSQTLDKTIEKKLRDEIKNLGIERQARKDESLDDLLSPVNDEDRIK